MQKRILFPMDYHDPFIRHRLIKKILRMNIYRFDITIHSEYQVVDILIKNHQAQSPGLNLDRLAQMQDYTDRITEALLHHNISAQQLEVCS